MRLLLCSLAILASLVTTVLFVSAENDDKPPFGALRKDEVTVSGIVYGYDGDSTRGLRNAAVTAWRDGKTVGRTASNAEGAFTLSVSKGTPVLITGEHEGYTQGKFACCRGDENTTLHLVLMSTGYAKDRWGAKYGELIR